MTYFHSPRVEHVRWSVQHIRYVCTTYTYIKATCVCVHAISPNSHGTTNRNPYSSISFDAALCLYAIRFSACGNGLSIFGTSPQCYLCVLYMHALTQRILLQISDLHCSLWLGQFFTARSWQAYKVPNIRYIALHNNAIYSI